MKSMVCELCGSNEFLKQDGMFVCQHCNTKYNLEDAKKLMVEVQGKVDVSGSTVKVDNSDSLSNLRQLARRARETGNSQQAAKYYDMVAVQDPNDWEAAFFSVYYQAAGTNIAGINSAATRVSNCIPTVMQMIKDNVPAENQKDTYMLIVEYVKSLCVAFYDSAKDHYKQFSEVDGAQSEFNDRKYAAHNMVYKTGHSIEIIFDDKQTALDLYLYCYNKDSGMKEKFLIESIANIDPDLAKRMEIQRTGNAGSSKIIFGLVFIFFGVLLMALSGSSFLVLEIISYVIGGILILVGIGQVVKSSKMKAEYNNNKNQ